MVAQIICDPPACYGEKTHQEIAAFIFSITTHHTHPMKYEKYTPDEYRRRLALELWEHSNENRRIVPTAAHLAIDCLCVLSILCCMVAIWLMIF